MAGESLKFDLTDLYMAAPYFQRVGGQIGDAVSSAQSQLMGMGAFWGNDAPGEAFGATYAKNQDEILQLIAIVAGELNGITDGLNQTAANYGIAENANVNKMRAMEMEEQ